MDPRAPEKEHTPRDEEDRLLGGNLVQAERLRQIALARGPAAVPLLVRALAAGSAPIREVALRELARIDPLAAAEPALRLLAAADEEAELRASAAEALGRVPTEEALQALRGALLASPLVASAALAALGQRGAGCVDRLREDLRRLAGELAAPGAGRERELARRLRAFGGLLGIVAQHSFGELEGELLVWWRTHPQVAVQCLAAEALLRGGVGHACLLLAEGIPGSNEGQASGTGELDGPARALLPGAALIILRGPAPEAHERLSPHLRPAAIEGWFGHKRAEVILLLLLGQLGHNPTSWLWSQADELSRRGQRPDPRWREEIARLPSSAPGLQHLGHQLSALLAR